MMRLSVKSFVIGMLLFLLLSEAVIFFLFYQDSKQTTEQLLKENIRANTLNLKHFLDKNIQKEHINEIFAFLDNKVTSSPLIKDIHILDENGKLLYATDRDYHSVHEDESCYPIASIMKEDIEQITCFTFHIKQYRGLSPYFLKSYIYLDHHYIDALMTEKIRNYLIYALSYLLFFALFTWVSIKYILVNPLEKLRQYAYYSNKLPKKMLLRELESIRYSMELTFKRLKKEQEELFALSTKDPLSGLYNRLSLIEKINWFIHSSKSGQSRFALLFLDLDNFKAINDIHGHDFGDKILIEISKQILGAVRANDIVSRFGGDEFVIVLPDIESDDEIHRVIEKIQLAFKEPISINNMSFRITCSIGITIYPKDGESVSTLLKHADIAMYKAKEKGKNNFHFFTESLNHLIQEKIHIEKMMHKALEEGDFQLYYQPKINIADNRLTGCEALVRMVDPMEGTVFPDKFIPVAEENGFIIPLGNWIIDEAVRQLKAWQDTPFGKLKISINISGLQLNDARFLSYLKNAVRGIDPSLLDLEITESVMMQDFQEKIEIIKEITRLGISLSLDDFGTGYSSLSYLKRIPFHTLKIDKSFIDDLRDEKDQAFVKMIVSIAKELQLSIVAEGVENDAQLNFLKEIHCDCYQGYLCAKPLAIEAFEQQFHSLQCNK